MKQLLGITVSPRGAAVFERVVGKIDSFDTCHKEGIREAVIRGTVCDRILCDRRILPIQDPDCRLNPVESTILYNNIGMIRIARIAVCPYTDFQIVKCTAGYKDAIIGGAILLQADLKPDRFLSGVSRFMASLLFFPAALCPVKVQFFMETL